MSAFEIFTTDLDADRFANLAKNPRSDLAISVRLRREIMGIIVLVRFSQSVEVGGTIGKRFSHARAIFPNLGSCGRPTVNSVAP